VCFILNYAYVFYVYVVNYYLKLTLPKFIEQRVVSHFAFLHGDTAHFYGISYSKPGRSRRDSGNTIAKAIEYCASISHNFIYRMKDFR